MHRGLSDKLLRSFNSNHVLQNLRSRAIPHIPTDYQHINSGFGKLYAPKFQPPFVPVDAQGPFLKTSENKIIYDAGGYGMLGFGHNPPSILSVLSKPQVMANIMTPNVAQYEFMEVFRQHNQWFENIFCLNSGSEGNELALRIANIHNRPNSAIINLKGSFHGRTNGPAVISDSCQSNYREKLANFDNQRVYSVLPNDLGDLQQQLQVLKQQNIFVELMVMESVMGEGNPGYAITPEYYEGARRLIKEQGGLVLIDSVQAGLRCTGKLSMANYPGFESVSPPDMECYSKAITGGQFPLSVLACGPDAQYSSGLYGNTMTANPRGLRVATTVLKEMSDYESNIRSSGPALHQRLEKIKQQYPDIVNHVSSTGLLLAFQLNDRYDYIEVERRLRENGLNCIHGGHNCIRLTPWFGLDEAEIELIGTIVEETLSDL